jgi:hypothetical protein
MRLVSRIPSFVVLARIMPQLAICILLIGCGSSQHGSNVVHSKRVMDAKAQNNFADHADDAVALAQPGAANAGKAAGPDAGQQGKPAVQRKIISTSRVELISDNFEEDKQKVEELVSALKLTETGGYVSQREVNGSTGGQRYGVWTVRSPLDKVDELLRSLSTVAELIKSDTSSNDVTDQFVDLSARVKNKQQEETRLLSHLEKSGTLPDTLLLEKELSRVREEVERLQGQMNVLTAATDLATINIRLQERSRFQPPPSVAAMPFTKRVMQSFMNSYQNLVAFLEGCAILLAGASPWAIAVFVIAAPCWLISRFLGRRAGVRTV